MKIISEKARWAKTIGLTIATTAMSGLLAALMLMGRIDMLLWLVPSLGIAVMVTLPIGYYLFGREQIIQTLNHKLSAQLSQDQLTGAMSRWAFFDMCRGNRFATDGIVMIADLDHFKRVNDTHGHAAGDAVLCMAVRAMQRVIGDQGVVARLGGEEFAIWLPDMDTKTGRMLADAICSAVAGEVVNVDDVLINCTTSIGASFARAGQVVDVALSQADQALYCAKNNGRDCAEFHEWKGRAQLRRPKIAKSAAYPQLAVPA